MDINEAFENEFNPDLHPRQPAKAPDGKGGQFRKKDVEPFTASEIDDEDRSYVGLKDLWRLATDDEKQYITPKTYEAVKDILLKLPEQLEYDVAAIAITGRSKKGWYKDSHDAVTAVFGQDAPRFCALLAALSPQAPVANNLKMSLIVWATWLDAGRPSTPEALQKMVDAPDILSHFNDAVGIESASTGTMMDAYKNNVIRALSATDEDATKGKLQLSGPKVDSFYRNLMGEDDPVTLDGWMARIFEFKDGTQWDAAQFSGATIKKKGEKGFKTKTTVRGSKPGYIAASMIVRRAAEILTDNLHVKWTPANVQETVWSWMKTLSDKRGRGGKATEILNTVGLTHDEIFNTPDFANIFVGKVFMKLLALGDKDGDKQYVKKLETFVGERGRDSRTLYGKGGDSRTPEGTGFTKASLEVAAKRTAEKIDRFVPDKGKKKGGEEDLDESLDFEHKHPRMPKGNEGGGRFAVKLSGKKLSDFMPVKKAAWDGTKEIEYTPHSIHVRPLWVTTASSFMDKLDKEDTNAGDLNKPLQKLHEILKKTVGSIPIVFTTSSNADPETHGATAYYKPKPKPKDVFALDQKASPPEWDYDGAEVVVFNDMIENGYSGKYLTDYVVTHELVHAFTVRGMRSDPQIKHKFVELANIMFDRLPHVGDGNMEDPHISLNDLGLDAKNPYIQAASRTKGGTDQIQFYGASNVFEFVAEAMTNIVFQKALSKLKLTKEEAEHFGVPEWRAATMWDGFLAILRNVLGLPNNKEHYSVLDAVVSLTDRQALAAFPQLQKDKEAYLKKVPSHKLFEQFREACKKLGK